jgi:hypothetical protein
LNSNVASKEQLTNLSASKQERRTESYSPAPIPNAPDKRIWHKEAKHKAEVYYAPQPEERDQMNADNDKSLLNKGMLVNERQHIA